GVEALLRWQDPETGLVAPAVFLPLLESAGLMTAAGTWVIRQAASDCRAWRLKGLPPLRVAVNVSPPELRRRKIADEILECIGDLAGDPHWGVDLEITEGVLSGAKVATSRRVTCTPSHCRGANSKRGSSATTAWGWAHRASEALAAETRAARSRVRSRAWREIARLSKLVHGFEADRSLVVGD